MHRRWLLLAPLAAPHQLLQALHASRPSAADARSPFRYIARIHARGEFVCAGAYYREDIVITTATYARLQRHLYAVLVPAANASGLAYRATTVRGIDIHPRSLIATAPKYDLALLKLNRPEKRRTGLALAAGPAEIGRFLTMFGWGEEERDFDIYEIPVEIDLPVYHPAECARLLQDPLEPAVELCAGYTVGNRDAHFFPIGSPLLVYQYGVFHLVGLYSWAETYHRQYFPNVFTRIAPFRSWIHRKAKLYEDI